MRCCSWAASWLSSGIVTISYFLPLDYTVFKGGRLKPQVPPLRCAPVGMTILCGYQHPGTQTNLSSRPERSVVEGPAVSAICSTNVDLASLRSVSSFWACPSVLGVRSPTATSAPADTPARLPVQPARFPRPYRAVLTRNTPGPG